MLGRKKSRIRKRAGTHAKWLRFELLEPRCLLAAATLVEPQQFRADDVSIAGSFTFELRDPASYNYIERITNGNYTSTAGHIAWTSPWEGTGFIGGQATGDGSSTINNQATKFNSYGIEETGRFDFSIDAAQKQLHMVTAVATATRYTYYNSFYPPYSEPSNPVPSHFFGGFPSLYSGTFDPSTQKVSINYTDSSPATTASSPPAALHWADQTATDMVLTINKSPILIPDGWVTVPQTSQLAIDLAQGLEFTVDVHGKPVPTANVQQPVGTVRFYWAASATDTTGAVIPVTSDIGTLGVYWNSSHLHSIVKDFPTPPAGASFVRVTIDAPSSADAIASNSTQFLRIEKFQAGSDTSGPVSADSVFDGQAQSLLAAADFADPNIKVVAYAPTSSLGAVLQVVNDRGGYRYNPTGALPQVQALALGETANDVVQFLAVKDQAAVSLASHTITVMGVNDPPVTGTDTSATTSYRKLLLAADTLLSNDTDVDHNDVIALSGVASTSQQGAAVQAILDANSKIVQIEYNPVASSQLKALAPGQQLSDEFTYTIVDQQGAQATGRVVITVTGSQLLTISSVPPQYTSSGQPTAAIPITVGDPDGDANNLQLSGQAADPSLIANLQFSGTGQQRQLVITPVPGNTGQTQIQVTVSNALGRSASVSFLLVVYSTEDSDLDGVPDAVENAGPNAGDMNGDGILDRLQSNVATLRGYGTGAFLCLTVPAPQAFSHVAVSNPVPSGPAANAQFPLGLVQYELLVGSLGAASTVTFRTNLATPTLNRFYQYDAPDGGGVGWRTCMDNGDEGARVFADRIEVKVRDGGRGDQSRDPDGQIIAEGAPAHVARPWQNDQPPDVNNDGLVAPLDVLTLIIQINLGRLESLGELPQGTDSLPPFLDTTGDNMLSALDVLTVINYLNNAVGGEGETTAPTVAAPVPNTSVSLVLTTQTLDTAVWPDASDLSRTTEPLVGPAVVQPIAVRATTAKRQADIAADVDSLLAELGRLTEM